VEKKEEEEEEEGREKRLSLAMTKTKNEKQNTKQETTELLDFLNGDPALIRNTVKVELEGDDDWKREIALASCCCCLFV